MANHVFHVDPCVRSEVIITATKFMSVHIFETN